jgi:hypothetical protein
MDTANETTQEIQFEYVGLKFYSEAENSPFQKPSANATRLLGIFGRLTGGNLHMGDTVVLPTGDGHISGVVVRFFETLFEVIGLPFYQRIEPGKDLFCVCVWLSELPVAAIACPGMMEVLKSKIDLAITNAVKTPVSPMTEQDWRDFEREGQRLSKKRAGK